MPGDVVEGLLRDVKEGERLVLRDGVAQLSVYLQAGLDQCDHELFY